jgi:hypothetical protein
VTKFGNTGSFTFTPDKSDTDVTSFSYTFNGGVCANSVSVAAGKSLTVKLSPPLAGPNVLYVCATDSAGNISGATAYVFYVTPKDTADTPGDVTGDTYPDLFVIDDGGNLRMFAGNSWGDLHRGADAAHRDGKALRCDLGGTEQEVAANCWADAAGNPALITHFSDVHPGDGVTDLFARMPDGRFFVYQGDGYGGFDVSRRLAVGLPDNAPDPATYKRIIVGDYNLDKRPDLFLTTATGDLWALTGYTGAGFSSATKLLATAWLERDLVSVGDHNGDGAPDLMWRIQSTGELKLRYGKPATSGGAALESLATAGASLNGADLTYVTGWITASLPASHIYGVPDSTRDGIPDIWSMTQAGAVAIHKGGATTLGTVSAVIGADSDWLNTMLGFG